MGLRGTGRVLGKGCFRRAVNVSSYTLICFGRGGGSRVGR